MKHIETGHQQGQRDHVISPSPLLWGLDRGPLLNAVVFWIFVKLQKPSTSLSPFFLVYLLNLFSACWFPFFLQHLFNFSLHSKLKNTKKKKEKKEKHCSRFSSEESWSIFNGTFLSSLFLPLHLLLFIFLSMQNEVVRKKKEEKLFFRSLKIYCLFFFLQ